MPHPLDLNVFSLHTATVADPGAGAQFQFPCPANARIEILSVNYLETTAAGGVVRMGLLHITTGGAIHSIAMSSNMQAGGIIATWSWLKQTGRYSGTSALRNMGETLPAGYFLEPGDILHSSIYNFGIFDTLTNINIRYALWHLGSQ